MRERGGGVNFLEKLGGHLTAAYCLPGISCLGSGIYYPGLSTALCLKGVMERSRNITKNIPTVAQVVLSTCAHIKYIC